LTDQSHERTSPSALVDRDTFERLRIWLPEFALAYMAADRWSIEGKTFTDCLLEGPAVIALTGEVHFEDCNLGVAREVQSLFYRPRGPRVIGAIGFAKTRFVRCRFSQIGFAGLDAFIDPLEEILRQSRERDEAGEA